MVTRQNQHWWLNDHIESEDQRKETLKRGLLHFLKTHFPRTFPPPRTQEHKL